MVTSINVGANVNPLTLNEIPLHVKYLRLLMLYSLPITALSKSQFYRALYPLIQSLFSLPELNTISKNLLNPSSIPYPSLSKCNSLAASETNISILISYIKPVLISFLYTDLGS